MGFCWFFGILVKNKLLQQNFNIIYKTVFLAGNLTRDKDGYKYKYDYENRIVKISKDVNGVDVGVAEFAYDALGRRIEKKDLIDPSKHKTLLLQL